MNEELIVAIVVGHAQLVRELAAVGLYHVGDTGTEGALNTGQLLKYGVAGSMRGIAQILFRDFKGVLRKHGTRRAAGINQLIRHVVGTVRVLRHLTNHNGVNAQRRPCRRLHFLSATRLLRQARAIERVKLAAVAQVSRHDTAHIFRRSTLPRPLERHNADWACRVDPLGNLDAYFCVQHCRPQH